MNKLSAVQGTLFDPDISNAVRNTGKAMQLPAHQTGRGD